MAAVQEVHVGDEGTEVRATLTDQDGPVDVSSAALTLTFAKPNAAGSFTRTAIPGTADPGALITDGSDGRFYYTTVAGDLDMPGLWQVQGHVAIGAGRWSTDIETEYVYPNLS